MGNKSSVLKRAKRVERKVQQYLWPGSAFTGGAKRPALEREDVRGKDRRGQEWWGEVKNLSQTQIAEHGGPWAVLERALLQVEAAIESQLARARTFAVLWPKGARREDQRLVMFEMCSPGHYLSESDQVLVVVPLAWFRGLVGSVGSVAGLDNGGEAR